VEVTSTPTESSFFRAIALLKFQTGLHFHMYSEFRHTSKNFEGGDQKIFLRKTLFSEKRVSNYGRLTVHIIYRVITDILYRFAAEAKETRRC
jgi:hypothetical protein